MIAIDIPVGLPQRAGKGGRTAETLVRPLLGERQSSVFSVPSRAALAANNYRDACAIALAACEAKAPMQISDEAYNLMMRLERGYSSGISIGGRAFPFYGS